MVPALNDFTYDVYFWIADASVSQALEFDINQFVGRQSFIWGHECRIAGGHEWDTWDNQRGKMGAKRYSMSTAQLAVEPFGDQRSTHFRRAPLIPFH